MENILIYLLLGSFAGILAGLLGVGGGLIIVPVLAWFFASQHFPPELLMQLAVGTSLATIIPTSISSIHAHHKKAAVLWTVFLSLIPGIIIGALLGAVIADQLPSHTLKLIFAIFVLMVAAQLFFGIKPHASRGMPGQFGRGIAGTVIGSLSAIVGIGGGSLTVPYLLINNIKIQQAIATSSACGLPIAMAGAFGFIITGWNTNIPEYSLGYVYLPAFITISISSVLFAPLGAHWAYKVDGVKLKKGFAIFLLIVGVKMLLG